jgi:Uma2 family endonuclease
MTALLATPANVPIADRSDNCRKVILSDVPWQAYKSFRQALRDRNIFLTYDQGALEIMTLSAEHEQFKGKLAILVHLLARHFRKNFASFGSFTQQRDDLEKGIESDDCYYIDSLPKVVGKKNIDLEFDPPPDLALEVDVSHSSMDRLSICAALGIAEVWRFDGRTITVHVLVDGDYQTSMFSPTFPGIPINKVVRFIFLGLDKGDMVMWHRFEKWLQKFPRGGKKRGKP